MPLSRQAMENKREYNKEYVKEYRKNNDLIAFNTYLPRTIANEIKEYLKKKNMNKKEFVLWAYEELKKRSD